jgi:hypothetical protein
MEESGLKSSKKIQRCLKRIDMEKGCINKRIGKEEQYKIAKATLGLTRAQR